MRAALVTKTWHDHRKGMLGWSIGLVAITSFQLAVYPSLEKSADLTNQLFEALPEAFSEAFRITDYTSGAGYLGAEIFSFTLPLAFIAIGVSWAASATAGEEERGTADLLMTLPVSRDTVILTKLASILTAMLALAALEWLTLLLGSRLVGLEIGTFDLLAACLALVLLCWIFAALALLAGAMSGSRAVAIGVSIALALGAFVLYSLGPLVSGLEDWLKASPFHWAFGNDPLRNGVSPGYTLLMLAVTATAALVAVLAFRRRDLGT